MVAALALIAGLAVFIQIQQRIFRWRAERLLEDMRELQSHKSTWADAQKIMTRWGEWSSYEGGCTQEQCTYHIYLQESVNAFLLRHWEQIPLPWLLEYPYSLVGGRKAAVYAGLRIKGNIVKESQYELRVLVLFGNSREAAGGYDLIGITSQLADGFGENFRTDRLLHPEYWIGVTGGCEGCIKFMTEFTPLAGREKIRELTDFNFSCITRWFSCTSETEIMPSAWKQFQQELPSRQARLDAFDHCTVPLDFFGLEDENIAVADIISRQAIRAPDSNYLAVRLRVTRVLKGQIRWPLNEPEYALVYDRGGGTQRWNSTNMSSGQRYILLAYIGKDQSGNNEVAIDNCGVIPYNEENLAAIQRGIDASLARRLPEK
ncbi:MAG: hypothetical protein ABSC48_05365 [Terracidiphilus sp.]